MKLQEFLTSPYFLVFMGAFYIWNNKKFLITLAKEMLHPKRFPEIETYIEVKEIVWEIPLLTKIELAKEPEMIFCNGRLRPKIILLLYGDIPTEGTNNNILVPIQHYFKEVGVYEN